jgi:hypothetical protein
MTLNAVPKAACDPKTFSEGQPSMYTAQIDQ